MAKIIKAEPSGFCFGVKKALEITEKTMKEYPEKRIFTLGQLIHNQGVTDRLTQQGLGIIDALEEGKAGDVIIIRSHGAPSGTLDKAKEIGLTVVDATCPFVKKIHELVREASDEGKTIVVVGNRNHPEVIGVVGWCSDINKVFVVDSEVDAEEIRAEDILIVAQTTITKELFDHISAVIKKNNRNVSIKNTICNATSDRQKATSELAKKSDCMVIIGGRNSSNSRKLFDISRKYCNNTVFIENINELSLKNLPKYSRIGIAAGASTPVSDIEEVISSMSEVITERNEMEDYLEAIEKSLRLPRLGEIVEGTIHQVTDKEIIVNLGCKKDGVIPKDELTLEGDQKITELYKVGDPIQAKVIKTDDSDGTIMLSKKKLEVNENWEEISEALDNKSTINVKVIRVVNGGVIAAYKEVAGFIPLSQLSDKFVENADEFVGQVMPVKISRVDKYKGKAVFSHKAYLAEERQKKMAEIWDKLSVGDVIEGTVMRFTDYGAFIDIGGIDGLLHISEISWGKLKHPQEVLEIGQKVKVKVLSMNSERGKISLGLKQTQPEPWSVIDEKYQVGQVLSGKVVQIKEYGAFIELEPGLDGLVHNSEVAHKRVTDLASELSLGQEVTAKILEIDKDKKRISLSIKETLEPPIYDSRVDEIKEAAAEKIEDLKDSASEILEKVKEAAAEAIDDLKEKIDDIKEDIQESQSERKDD